MGTTQARGTEDETRRAAAPETRSDSGRQQDSCPGLHPELTRRHFLLLGGAALVAIAVPGLGAGPAMAHVRAYPRKKIGSLGRLSLNRPQEFFYPFEHPNMKALLIRLGQPSGGGVGRKRDIVAFNSLCPHQGAPLTGRYNARHGVLGPCPLHLSTFDLTRHGMVVSGSATQGLPQILLEVDGDDIYATGVLGLVYGFHDNLAGRSRARGTRR
jgi:arsenite oxidase small subunit